MGLWLLYLRGASNEKVCIERELWGIQWKSVFLKRDVGHPMKKCVLKERCEASNEKVCIERQLRGIQCRVEALVLKIAVQGPDQVGSRKEMCTPNHAQSDITRGPTFRPKLAIAHRPKMSESDNGVFKSRSWPRASIHVKKLKPGIHSRQGVSHRHPFISRVGYGHPFIYGVGLEHLYQEVGIGHRYQEVDPEHPSISRSWARASILVKELTPRSIIWVS